MRAPDVLVSIVVCSYNAASTLPVALDSAMAQGLPADEFEVLLIDDGSTDATPRVAARYASKFQNVRYHRLLSNAGLPKACNHGVDLARGKYFIRLDADDAFDRDILQESVAPLERDETDFVYCDRYDEFPADGDARRVEVRPARLFDLIACGSMLRTALLRDVGGYRSVFWEEFDLYIRYLHRSVRSPVRIARPLYHYRRHRSSMTADEKRAQSGWEELRRLWGNTCVEVFQQTPLEALNRELISRSVAL